MDPKEMALTELAPGAQTTLMYHLEWVMDPPPFILRRLPDDLVQNIYRVKMQHLARAAELEAELVKVRGAMYQEIAKIMPGIG